MINKQKNESRDKNVMLRKKSEGQQKTLCVFLNIITY